MACPDSPRRLIVNADDFGRSPAINEAVIRTHEEGILTSASLMVAAEAANHAVALARAHPRLGVGLHLTLVCGSSALPPAAIPRLVDAQGRFRHAPVQTGLRYFFRRDLRAELAGEIGAQLARFRATGLPLDHVNGHLNLHLHPTILGLLLAPTNATAIHHFRLTRDRFWLNTRLAPGHWAYRVSHALIFNLLCQHARARLRQRGIRCTHTVFGLLQNGRVDENYVLRLLPRLPPGDSELYSHPSLDQSRQEFDALVSPRVRALVRELNIQLIRYRDL